MYRLLDFLKRYYVAFLFVVLEAGAIAFYARSTSYTRATLLSSANKVTAGASALFASVGDYFTLARDNRVLLERLAAAETRIAALDEAAARDEGADTDSIRSKYFYSTAKVISNSIARQDNFFIIDKGLRDRVEENTAVLAANGAVAGYVRDCSERYAVCMSVINRDFSIGGRIQGSDYFGSVYWNGTDPRQMTMLDIPRYAPVAVGDTVLSAYSLRFPPDCFIGTVDSVKPSEDGTAHVITVRLGARMNALSDVLLVKYSDYAELETLAGEQFGDSGTNP